MSILRYQTPELTAWSPYDRLSSLRGFLDSAFHLANYRPENGPAWAPALDVLEDDEKVTIVLDAAGLKSEDFDLSLQDGDLTISGERKQEEDSQKGESFRSERFFGRFSRTITLPSPVKAEAVQASYKDGVLTVTLPKAEEAKPKKITVGLN